MFILAYCTKDTNLARAMTSDGVTGFNVKALLFSSEKAARDKAAVLHNQNRNHYDFYLGELTMAAAVAPPPPLEFKSLKV